MARLLIKTAGLENRTLELRLGINRVGRDPNCDFAIHHPSISSIHCEIIVSADGVLLRDCASTNGTFLNGDPVAEAWLMRGQEVQLGEVEMFVESTEVNVAIPKFERERPKSPIALEGGAIACSRHAQEVATYRCTHCKDVMCNHCIRIMRIKGGTALFLCPSCSNKCEPIVNVAATKKKKGFFANLADTVKMKFSNPTKPRSRD
ncbi:MAG TPA: FHA domain-containing protein [Candidatus Baltobacteraceae bacterium]|nr:FHA domain-containing protein [Candidatus Baltobacteraceae bacterium]